MKISLLMFESLLAELAEKMALPPEVFSLYAFTSTQRVQSVWFVQKITAAAQIQPKKSVSPGFVALFALRGQGPQCDSRVRRLECSWQQKIAFSKTAFRSEQNYDDHRTMVVAITVRS